MMKENWIYRRGDIYIANLGEPVGSEQGGIRPVLVIQNNVGNRFSPTLEIAPLHPGIKDLDCRLITSCIGSMCHV